MQLFLEIPERTAKGMNQKCIQFLANLLAGEEEEELLSGMDLGIEKSTHEKESSEASLTGVKRKKFKNVDFGIFSQLFKALAIFLIVEVYFVINYMIGKG